MPADLIRVVVAAGARPNFMKVAPLMLAFDARPETFETTLVHTGQHYDNSMSDVFFSDLKLRAPDAYLGAGSGTHGEQTAAVLVTFEKLLEPNPPDIVLVTGDVNSTLAASLAARKMDVPVGHVEAGLRSRNWLMPEETNRILTDVISDYLFTPSADADKNLKAEGIASERIHRVGNIMIDSLERAKDEARRRRTAAGLNLQPGNYGLITLHRPSNIDNPEKLRAILDVVQKTIPHAVFPVHPRTRKQIDELSEAGLAVSDNIVLVEPIGYYDFLSLMMDSQFVLTDSGGIQEETTYLGIPCMTLRDETERPITISEGTNELVTLETLEEAVDKVRRGDWKAGRVPELWDGRTAERIVDMLAPGIERRL